MSHVGHEHAVEHIYSDAACTEGNHNHSDDSEWETDQCYTKLVGSVNTSYKFTCSNTTVTKTTWSGDGTCNAANGVGIIPLTTTYSLGACLSLTLEGGTKYAKWECETETAAPSTPAPAVSDASTTFSATLLLVLGFLRLAA